MNKLLPVIVLCCGLLSGIPAAIAQNFQWANSIGTTNFEEGSSITVDQSGNLYITGYFEGTADFDPGTGVANLTSVGNWDIFIAKYDANGGYLWAKRLGGTLWEEGYCIAVDGSGNCHITGYFEGTVDFDPGTGTANLSSSGGGDDIYFAKYDANGNYIYAKKIGSSGYDYGMSIAVDTAGNGSCYLTGYFSGTADFNPGTGTANLTSAGFDDIFFAKYDSSGNYVWAKKIGGWNTDYGRSIVVDPAGSGAFYIAGEFRETVDFDPGSGTATMVSEGNYDVYFAKYDAGGNYLWAKAIAGTSSDNCAGIAIDPAGSGYCCITGYFSGTCDFNPDTAGMANLTSAAYTDIFFAKYDANGNYLWAKNIGGTSSNFGTGIAIDRAGSGKIFITGYFRDTSDFDPGPGVVTLTSGSAGYEDIYIAEYDASGNYLWAGNIGGTYLDKGKSIVADASGNCYFTGFFSNTADFDIETGVANFTSVSTNKYDIFFAKYEGDTTTIVGDAKISLSGNDPESVSVFFHPNPVVSTAIITCSLHYNANTRIEIFNRMGQKIMDVVNTTQQKGAYAYEISFEDEPAGLYFYKVTTSTISLSGKIIVMK